MVNENSDSKTITGLTSYLLALIMIVSSFLCIFGGYLLHNWAINYEVEKIRFESSANSLSDKEDIFEKIKDNEFNFAFYSFSSNALLAIGTSLFATVIFYVLYSTSVEKRILIEVTESTSKIAVKYANELYSKRFDQIVPDTIFPATNSPIPEFQKKFNEVLKSSRIYNFKGEEGGYTIFRIQNLSNADFFLGREIKLLVLDPRENLLLRERAKVDLAVSNSKFSKDDLESNIKKIRKSIFATLVAVFDLSHKTRIEIGFHSEHLFFRSEIFDDGMFLTFYLGGEFPGTYFYPSRTYIYKAFAENFRQIHKCAELKTTFSTTLNDKDLKNKLKELDCEFEIQELRTFIKETFDVYERLSPKS